MDTYVVLDSLRDELDSWKEFDFIDNSCIRDIASVMDMFESDASDIIKEYARIRAVLGYWVASVKQEVHDIETDVDKRYSIAVDTAEGSITEKKSKASMDTDYCNTKMRLNSTKRVLDILESLLDIMKESDVLVQMSVNRRREDDIDNTYN